MTKSDMAVSKVFSARFLVVVIMTLAGCYMALRGVPIDNQFSTLWGVVVTYYFGKGPSDDMKTEKKDVSGT